MEGQSLHLHSRLTDCCCGSEPVFIFGPGSDASKSAVRWIFYLRQEANVAGGDVVLVVSPRFADPVTMAIPYAHLSKHQRLRVK